MRRRRTRAAPAFPLGVLAIAFTCWVVPETKGRTVEQIEAYWRARKHDQAA